MMIIEKQAFDEERALYGREGIVLRDCAFDGPADGESALKESRDIQAQNCFFNLRYPFWHAQNLKINNSEMTPLCRAALWYSRDIEITGSKLHGIKALRECEQVTMKDCRIISPEFGWSTRNLKMEDTTAESEYFMMRAEDLTFRRVRLQGKYSFQYIQNALFEDCELDTKDAFWHAKNVTIRNSVVKGEYLAWYCENVTFENCRIIGTQPFCYCKALTLRHCQMEDADLCFERSEVEATITTPVVSIKNPLAGRIFVPAVGEIIRESDAFRGEVIIG